MTHKILTCSKPIIKTVEKGDVCLKLTITTPDTSMAP